MKCALAKAAGDRYNKRCYGVYFLYTEDEFTEPIQEELQSINVQDHYSDIPHDINIKIDFPIENYLENGNQIIVLVDGRIFTN